MAIEDKVEDDDLVQTMFNGLPTTWETFLASLYGRGIQPNFERMRHDCLDEESRIQSRFVPPLEKNQALAIKTKKGKNPSPHKDNSKEPRGKYSFKTRVKCYNCGRHGHYAWECRKSSNKSWHRRKNHVSVATEEEQPQQNRSRVETKNLDQGK